jgi:hypothetical protein
VELITAEMKHLVCDEQYQMRVEIPDTEDYSEQLRATESWPFPPLVVFRKGKKFVILEGFTRHRAALVAKWNRPIPIQVVPEDQAWIVALAANAEHGYRRTNADKRKAVLQAWKLYPDERPAHLARRCRVSQPYVHRQVQSLRTGVAVEQIAGSTKGPCPNCHEDLWIENDEGWVCSNCGHAFGEPAARDDPAPRTPAAASGEKSGQNVAQSGPSVAAAKLNGKIDHARVKRIANARTAVGGLIREMKELGVLTDTVEAAWTIIKTALNKAK